MNHICPNTGPSEDNFWECNVLFGGISMAYGVTSPAFMNIEVLGMELSSFGLNGSLWCFIWDYTACSECPTMLVYALVCFVWLYLAFNKRFLSFWAKKKKRKKKSVVTELGRKVWVEHAVYQKSHIGT